MEIDRPGPGEELNAGAETVPRPAATVILLRGGADGLEVLLVQRNPESRFMGGAWVFPGGAVNRAEGDGPAALRTAAIRELDEEAGIRLEGPEQLVPFSRWITPAQVKIRFDTWFFLAKLPAGRATEDRRRRDRRPRAGMRRRRRSRPGAQGELLLVFPTIKHLEQLSGFGIGRRSDRPRPRPGGASRSSRGSSCTARPPGSSSPASPATKSSRRDERGTRPSARLDRRDHRTDRGHRPFAPPRALDRSKEIGRIVAMARRPFDPAAAGLRKTEYRQADVLDRDAVAELVAGADVVVHLAFVIIGGRERPSR